VLPGWHQYLDVLTYEFFEWVTSHVCEALVQIGNDATTIQEDGAAREGLE
jgi:hypothetical protein